MFGRGTLSAGLVSIVLLANIACASIPQLISIQGRLTDAAGAPLTGSHNLTFLIYNASSDGSALWTEYHDGTNNVTVTNGVFNALLGSIVALNLPFNESYWLEVVVNGETQSPRINFTSSAYAFRANKSEGLDCIGCVNDTHISSSANISPDKILGTAWTSANDGSGSGLDADTVDGSHKGNGSADLITGSAADSWISGNISVHNASSAAHSSVLLNAERVVMLDRLDFSTWDFTGTGSIAYTDFDCSAIVSAAAKKVIVYLELQVDGNAQDTYFAIKKKGATNAAGRARIYQTNTLAQTSSDTNTVICEMDANKKIQYTVYASAGTPIYYGRIVGYIETLA
jgi:hypothetical protein